MDKFTDTFLVEANNIIMKFALVKLNEVVSNRIQVF